MKEEITPEQTKKLLQAIFDEEVPEDDDNYPETVREKVDYAEYALTAGLGQIGRTLTRLSRLNRLLMVGEKDGGELPPIILHNELRMALRPFLHVKDNFNEVAGMLVEIYTSTILNEDGSYNAMMKGETK